LPLLSWLAENGRISIKRSLVNPDCAFFIAFETFNLGGI
jgi:hypothetical protein